MFNKIAPILLALTTGCTVYSYDTYEDPGETIIVYNDYNALPEVWDASAWVYYDRSYPDDIWVFEATVDDPDGIYDIIGVWADVYDDCHGGTLVDSFELYATSDPYYWTSEWLGSSTYLDPFYSCYSVDVVAYDTYEDFNWMTVPAITY